MKVEGASKYFVNSYPIKLMLEELNNACKPRKVGGFIPNVNIVAYLPGFMIMGRSVGLRGLIS